MCRFVMYLGESLRLESLITQPTNSLIRQSRESDCPTVTNGDGFGVAWYGEEDESPAVFKSISPAWSNRNLFHLARVTRSGCVLAHVRSASEGMPIHESNTHPFTLGRYSFMHNGCVAEFSKIRRRLLADLSDESFRSVEGTTDSEHVFALFYDAVGSLGAMPPVEALAVALESAVGRLLETLDECGVTAASQLNLAVADGRNAVALRFGTGPPETAPTLYWHEGRRYVCEGGVCRMVEADVRADTVIVSSEKLSDDHGWEPIAQNSMILIGEGRRPEVRRLFAAARPSPRAA